MEVLKLSLQKKVFSLLKCFWDKIQTWNLWSFISILALLQPGYFILSVLCWMCTFPSRQYWRHVSVCWCQTELVSLPLRTRLTPYVVQQIGSMELSVKWSEEDKEKMVKFSMGTDDGQRSRFIPFIYASVCPCAELSVSLAVTVVPVLSFFSQVTNSLISTYETTVDITEADVNVTVMYMRFQNLSMIFFFICFWHFTSAFLSSINVIWRLYVTVCCSNIEAFYAFAQHTLTFMC